MPLLKGITWNHTRGYCPMAASAQRFEELNPDIQIQWDKRSLQAFADEPIDQLAKRYDFLVIDHPWAGFAAKNNVILPLDKYLPEAFMKDQEEHAVGHSYTSYHFGDHQWALPIDAATPVASFRPDLLDEVPVTWDDLIELSKSGKVAVPSIPQDTLMNFYMLCCTMGEDPCESDEYVVSEEMGVHALQMLRELAVNLDRRCYDWNPIRVYEAMTQSDDFVYCPFAYGYSNYSQFGYARKPLYFGDMVDIDGAKLQSTLGGTGLAISAKSEHINIAVDYAEFVANLGSQKGLFFAAGGQPGHKKAWLDERINSLSENYFINTLPALERAFLRPRYAGHMYFQDNSGAPIRSYLMDGGDEKVLLAKLNELYRESLTK